MCRILGRRSSEILGREPSEFVDEDNAIVLREQAARRSRQEAGAYELALSRPDGSQVHCLLNATPMLDENGEKVGSFAMVTDIMERKLAEEKLKEAFNVISSSIDYASNIQRSLLPSEAFLAEGLAEHFVLWEPRDVVGGDLYWYRRCKGGFIIVLADCTGHGVPGAFMTMLATGALDRALRDYPDGDPALLLPVLAV